MRPLNSIRGIADALTYPFVVVTARWLIVLWLLVMPSQPAMSLHARIGLVVYALIAMLFSAGWWHGGQVAATRDDQHPFALPAIIIVDVVYAGLIAKIYGVTTLCMMPALDLAILNFRTALVLLASIDGFLALTAVYFQHMTLASAGLQVMCVSVSPYLAVAYGMHGRYRVEHQIRAIDQVLNAGSDLGAQVSLSDVLVKLLNLLRQFRRVVPWDTATVFVVEYDHEKSEDRLVAVETAGIDAAIYSSKKYSFGEGVVGYAAAKQRSALIGDLHKDPRELETCPSPGARGCIAVPIVCDGQTVGCVQLLATRPNAYNADQLGLIGRLISLAAVGIRNAVLHGSTKEIADIDSLTGLLTSRAYQERLETEFRKAQAARRSLSLLILDVDHFKNINDTHGHPAGDELLRRVGMVIRQQARRDDVGCRYGGDEFIVVMPETVKADAAAVAGRIRAAIENQAFTCDNRLLRTTVSIGVASYPQDVTSKAALIKAADTALYTAKQDGRNALRVFGPPALT